MILLSLGLDCNFFYTPPFGNDPRLMVCLMVCRVNENNIKHRLFIIFYIYCVLTVFIIRLV
jgi:hypothetical protein